MGVLEGARVAEHLAHGAVRAAERRDQVRQEIAAARADVAVRQPQAVVVPREPIDGAQLLGQVRTALNHFACWPSEHALTASVLFAAQAHGRDDKQMPIWQYAPHMLLTSEHGGSGKSWMGRLISQLCPSPEVLVEPTKASLVQMFAERKTIVLTEADVLLAGSRNRGMVGLINAAYEPDRSCTRMRSKQAERVPLFGSVLLDGLDTLIKSSGCDLRTLVSRCLVLRIRRAPDGYIAPRYDRTARAVFRRGSDLLGAWMAQQVQDGIADVVPQLPTGIGCRPAALWEPLMSVADAAGGPWPDLAREACMGLETAAAVQEDQDADTEYRAALDAWAQEDL